MVKCEGRDLGSEEISEFRPRSQMRLAQAVVVVFQDKLLERERMTGRWSAACWRGMGIIHMGSRRQPPFSCSSPGKRGGLGALAYWDGESD